MSVLLILTSWLWTTYYHGTPSQGVNWRLRQKARTLSSGTSEKSVCLYVCIKWFGWPFERIWELRLYKIGLIGSFRSEAAAGRTIFFIFFNLFCSHTRDIGYLSNLFLPEVTKCELSLPEVIRNSLKSTKVIRCPQRLPEIPFLHITAVEEVVVDA